MNINYLMQTAYGKPDYDNIIIQILLIGIFL